MSLFTGGFLQVLMSLYWSVPPGSDESIYWSVPPGSDESLLECSSRF